MPTQKPSSSKLNVVLWIALVVLSIMLFVVHTFWPESSVLTLVFLGLIVANLAWLGVANREALSSRTAAFGIQSAVTIVLVLGILSLVNFMGYRYPKKFDMTQNKTNSISEQTVKVLKELKSPVSGTFFYSTPQSRDQYRTLLENYREANSDKFKIESAEISKELIKVKAEGIRHENTLVLKYNGRSSQVEAPTEEKLTNALIKITRDKTPELCAVTGHGEKDFSDAKDQGYLSIKKGLENQSNVFKEINLLQTGAVPGDCDAVAVMGPTKAFFDKEIDALTTYLDNGGRLVVALDPFINGKDPLVKLKKLVGDWGVRVRDELILDQGSARFTQDMSLSLIPTFSTTHAITRDFQKEPAYFGAPRVLEAMPSVPKGITVTWLAKTLPTAMSISDFEGLKKGKVTQNPSNPSGALAVAYAIEGKKEGSKAAHATRIVVFGTSLFGANAYTPYGANFNFLMNSIAWALEDESMISIRPREGNESKLLMSGATFKMIFFMTVIVIPLIILASGLLVWIRRRRL